MSSIPNINSHQNIHALAQPTVKKNVDSEDDNDGSTKGEVEKPTPKPISSTVVII